MIWDFLKKKKTGKEAQPEVKAPAAAAPVPEKAAKPSPQPPAAKAASHAAPAEAQTQPSADKDLEKQLEKDLNRLEPGMAAQLRNPAVREKLMDLAKKMLKAGVDIKSEKAVKNWIKDHPEEVGGPAKVETFKRAEPKLGRNDLCSCGSGKKYKKCCGQNAA